MRSPDPMTQLEIARALGVSRQRVAEIEAAALAKLRAAFGTKATGPASLYLGRDGVPEPTEEPESRKGINGKTARRVAGRFA